MHNTIRSQLCLRRNETTCCQYFPEPQKTTYRQYVHSLGPKSHCILSYVIQATPLEHKDKMLE